MVLQELMQWLYTWALPGWIVWSEWRISRLYKNARAQISVNESLIAVGKEQAECSEILRSQFELMHGVLTEAMKNEEQTRTVLREHIVEDIEISKKRQGLYINAEYER